MLKVSTLNEILSNFLGQAKDIMAALVVDLEGLIIAQQSVRGFDEEIIGAIMSVLEGTIEKIKRFAETSYGSGTFDTNDYRIFYLELGGTYPALFVIVADPYADFNKYLSYSYIIAEKISQALNNKKVQSKIPEIDEKGKIVLKSDDNGVDCKNVLNKIIVIGAEKAGKSTLLSVFLEGESDLEYKPTIGLSIMEKELQITKRMKVTHFIYDMGGLKSFAKVRRHFYDNTNAVMILFDYSRKASLNAVNEWLEEAKHFIQDNSVPYILVGNKIDLVDERGEIKTQAQKYVDQYNFQFFETSAKTGEGLDELFMYLTSLGM